MAAGRSGWQQGYTSYWYNGADICYSTDITVAVFVIERVVTVLVLLHWCWTLCWYYCADIFYRTSITVLVFVSLLILLYRYSLLYSTNVAVLMFVTELVVYCTGATALILLYWYLFCTGMTVLIFIAERVVAVLIVLNGLVVYCTESSKRARCCCTCIFNWARCYCAGLTVLTFVVVLILLHRHSLLYWYCCTAIRYCTEIIVNIA